MTDYDKYGPSGLNLASFDSEVRPQDDLFTHVNGTWLANVEIPNDRSRYGAFDALRQLSEERVRAIIEDLSKETSEPGTVAQKIGDLYASFMDEATTEARGIDPIREDLSLAQTIASAEDLARIIGELEARGHGGFFSHYVNTDDRDSTRYVSYVSQSGLSLPDESYYHEEQHAELVVGLAAHITKMFALAGIADGADHAARVVRLETAIAAHHWDSVRDRDAELTYNLVSLDEWKALFPAFDLAAWMSSSLTPSHIVEPVVVRQPSFFEGLNSLLEDFDAAAWQSWLTWHVLSSSAPYLSKAFVDENFDFFGKTLTGQPEMRERWKRGVGVVEGGLGEAIGEFFVARHFPPAAKARMVQLVENLTEAYRADIATLEWMSEETKQKAYVKLDKFTPKIGYPDEWRDYSALTISRDDLVGNLQAINAFQRDFTFAKIGQPVNRNEWFMFPQTVNAYYNPGMNEIVFPAAILQPPFFNLEADDAVNYGGIGGVIGHEIGHGFDDQGSKYDGDGNMVNWWTDSDRREFEARAQGLIAQYDELSPMAAPEVKLNGALTIGENIGDLGGLTIALKAYEISLKGEEAPVLDGYTGAQRVFIGWAQVWRTKTRPELARQLATVDPHSPPEARCNQIVRNLDEFYDAFNVGEDDGLFMDSGSRVRIW
jgi:predicted metalloendopeptidase